MIILAVTAHHTSSIILVHSHEEEEEEEKDDQLWLANKSDCSRQELLPKGCCSRISPSVQQFEFQHNLQLGCCSRAKVKLLAQGAVNRKYEHVHARMAQLSAKVYKYLSKHASTQT